MLGHPVYQDRKIRVVVDSCPPEERPKTLMKVMIDVPLASDSQESNMLIAKSLKGVSAPFGFATVSLLAILPGLPQTSCGTCFAGGHIPGVQWVEGCRHIDPP